MTFVSRVKEWYNRISRDAQRDMQIRFTVSIPFCTANMIATEGYKVGQMERAIEEAVEARILGLRVKVKCVSNPDWRS